MKIQDKIMSYLIKKLGKYSTSIDLSFKHGFTSGVLMDYIYKNKSSGKKLIGKLVDYIFINDIGWKAVRQRKDNLSACILELINKNNNEINITDMACGPSTYLIDIISKTNRNNIKLTFQHLNSEPLALIQKYLSDTNLKNVTLLKNSLLDKQTASKQDLAIISGVFEWMIDDDEVKQSMHAANTILAPNGYFLFTHLSGHKKLDLVESTFIDAEKKPIRLKIRDPLQLKNWAEKKDFRVIKQLQDKWKLHTVTLCQKCEA